MCAGGDSAILLGQGRDCTALFESYHPFTDKAKNIIPKYQVLHIPLPLLLVLVAIELAASNPDPSG